jgi:hypothetical protein
MQSGWLNKDPEWKLYVLEDEDKTFIPYGQFWSILRMNLLQNLYSLDDDDAESTGIDPDYVSLFEQARMTLDHIGCSEQQSTKERLACIQGRDANILVRTIALYDASFRSNGHLPHSFVCRAMGKPTFRTSISTVWRISPDSWFTC